MLFITCTKYDIGSIENTLIERNYKNLQLHWNTITPMHIKLLFARLDQPSLFNFSPEVLIFNPLLNFIILISIAFLHLMM